MRKVSMATRAELILAIRGRYASAGRPEKTKILDEFVALTGFHRKHAMRLLRGGDEPGKGGPQAERRRKGSTAIIRSVPVRTFSDWNNPVPGFVEADLVAHSGPFAKGTFTQTL